MTIQEIRDRVEIIKDAIKHGGDPERDLGVLLNDLEREIAEAETAVLLGADLHGIKPDAKEIARKF